MRKVLNIISDTNIGGAGKILLSFLENYDRTAFDMAVVLPRGSLLVPEIKLRKVPVIEVDAMADKSYDKKDVDILLRVLREEMPDVIHCHGAFSARIAGRKYGKCKIISTRHSIFDQPLYKKIIPFKWAFGYINNHYSDTIIAVSPAAKDNIVEIGTNPKKVPVIFNGVDMPKLLTDEEKTQKKSELGISGDDFICAIIARLETVKGHSYVLKAARMLSEKHEPVKILIAGIGAAEQQLKKEAEGLENVIFLGFVKDIHSIENIMDLQLNASYGTEATSLSLLEGMSLGVPAIVSDFGGNPFVIQNGENGLVIPKKDEKALFDAILKLKEDDALRKKMSEGSKRIYAEKFTAKAMSRGIENVYNQ